VSEHTSLLDISLAWVETLTARGVSLRAKGKRLEWQPGSAYKATSDEEHATYRRCRTEILDVVRERYGGLARAAPGSSAVAAPRVTATADVAQPTCPHCYRTPCIGVEHPAFADLHPQYRPPASYDLREVFRSREGLVVVPG
jgi:hypothetical protein